MVRSTTTTSSGPRRSTRRAKRPPKQPPTTTTRWIERPIWQAAEPQLLVAGLTVSAPGRARRPGPTRLRSRRPGPRPGGPRGRRRSRPPGRPVGADNGRRDVVDSEHPRQGHRGRGVPRFSTDSGIALDRLEHVVAQEASDEVGPGGRRRSTAFGRYGPGTVLASQDSLGEGRPDDRPDAFAPAEGHDLLFDHPPQERALGLV